VCEQDDDDDNDIGDTYRLWWR